MKANIKHCIKLISLAAIVLISGSCGKELDVNTNPAAIKEVPANFVLPTAQSSLAFFMGSDMYLFTSIFSQQISGNGPGGNQLRLFDQYNVTNADVNNTYEFFYSGTLSDLKYIERQTAATDPAYAGVSKIMQAYVFQVLTDGFGNVPFSEALGGAGNTTPKYDDSKAVYDGLFALIDQGIADLAKESPRKPSGDDLIYNGDLAKWAKFGNTLKLRLALNYAKTDNGAKLKQIIDAGGPFMASNEDNFELVFSESPNGQNPIDRFEVFRQDQAFPAAFIVNLMNGKSDPRRAAYFTDYPYKSGIYVGNVAESDQTVDLSRIHTYLRGDVTSDEATPGEAVETDAITYKGDAPIRLLTFAEYNFIRAEAVLTYGAAGAAADFHKAGIESALTAAQVPAAAATAYVTAQTAAAPTLQKVIEEKYIANYGVTMQPWTDWRRTGFPALTPTVGNAIPRILTYPLSEQQTNAGNLPVRTSFFEKGVFWDN